MTADPGSILEIPPPIADLRLHYGTDPLQFMDLRFPSAEKPWPLVINIHGGFWRAAYDLDHAGHFCGALTKAGFATANVEYRRVGNPGGGWPGTLDDIRSAYKYLLDHVDELGCDHERSAVTGHSAGGHLAVCLAAYGPSVSRVMPLAGVLNLHRAYELHLSNDAVVEFLGGTPMEVPERYRAASPMDFGVKARQLVITGMADDTVPAKLSQDYVSTKKSAGENVELVEIPGATHLDVIDPRTRAFQVVLQSFDELLR